MFSGRRKVTGRVINYCPLFGTKERRAGVRKYCTFLEARILNSCSSTVIFAYCNTRFKQSFFLGRVLVQKSLFELKKESGSY